MGLTEQTVRSAFRFWAEEQVRFADLDPLGHVNNNAIGIYLENARVAMFARAGAPVTGDGSGRGPGIMLARLAIDFRSEGHYPGRLEIGLGLTRIGRSSITLKEGIFDKDRCIATAESVCVMIDFGERRPMEVPAEMRARFEELLGTP